jgi:predicted GNAT family N-acyltransferase
MSYLPVTELTSAHVDDLCSLYRNEWWTATRRREDIERMLMYTDALVAFADPDSGELVAFARILSDRVFKAFVFDVIVHPAHRGRGLGHILFDAVMHHEIVANSEHVELYCRPDLEAFYERWGFTSDLGELRLMRLTRM